MEIGILIAFFLLRLGITLAVGSSTFALAFYFAAIADGAIDPSERRFMHLVYFVLRIGMVITILSQLVLLGFFLSRGGAFGALDAAFWFEWTLLLIIIANAILMQVRVMPMWLGPALAGGSWYSFFTAHVLSDLSVTASYLTCFGGYALFVIFLVALFAFLKRTLRPRQVAL